MPNGWRTINSLVHKIRLHGRRGKGMAESFSRQKSRHAPQKEGGLKILCDLPPVWPRLVRPTNLMSRMDGKKTHTHTHTVGPLFLLPTPSSPHCVLKVSEHESLWQPPAAHSEERPPHKRLLVRNVVSMLSHRVLAPMGGYRRFAAYCNSQAGFNSLSPPPPLQKINK